VEIFCRCREKKPLFRVENDGYPRTSSLFALAAAHEMLPGVAGDNAPGDGPFGNAVPLAGMSPGLDHPPPGWGEGDRDKVIAVISAKQGIC
jgi:hypothetical protein